MCIRDRRERERERETDADDSAVTYVKTGTSSFVCEKLRRTQTLSSRGVLEKSCNHFTKPTNMRVLLPPCYRKHMLIGKLDPF